jgi:hypothetical protein
MGESDLFLGLGAGYRNAEFMKNQQIGACMIVNFPICMLATLQKFLIKNSFV